MSRYLLVIVLAGLLAACRSGSDGADVGAPAPSGAPPTVASAPSAVVFAIGGGPRVSVDSVAVVELAHPDTGQLWRTLTRVAPETWETLHTEAQQDLRLRQIEETANSLTLLSADGETEMVIDLERAEARISEPGGPPYSTLVILRAE